MFLRSVVSSFCLLASPVAIVALSQEPAIEEAFTVIRQHHLDSEGGRLTFLMEKLAPFANATEQLNDEIQALTKKIEEETSHTEILALTEQVSQKMDVLLGKLPALQIAFFVDEDFQAIDTILAQQEPLNENQKEIVLRIVSLCKAVE